MCSDQAVERLDAVPDLRPVQHYAAKGLAMGGGDCPKARQVSSRACKAPCSNCLGLVVIVEKSSGERWGLMTMTRLAYPEI